MLRNEQPTRVAARSFVHLPPTSRPLIDPRASLGSPRFRWPSWALQQVRTEDAALVSTYLMMIVGIFECVAGIVVAAFGVLEILRL